MRHFSAWKGDRKPKSAEPAKLKATSSDWSSGQNGLSKGLNKYPRPKGGEKVENSAGWAYYTSYIILTVGTTILVSLVCYSMSAVRRYEEVLLIVVSYWLFLIHFG